MLTYKRTDSRNLHIDNVCDLLLHLTIKAAKYDVDMWRENNKNSQCTTYLTQLITKHMCSKNDMDVGQYSFYVLRPMLIILGRNVTETISYQVISFRT